LDGYNREDILKNDLNYDNSGFLDALRSMGFMAVDCSMGNYTQTRLAMASELNLNYMDNYFPGKELVSRNPTTNTIFSDNAVRRLLENSGYQVYTFENSQWPFLNWENENHLLSSSEKSLWNRGITEFEKMFIESTLLMIPSQYRPDWIEMFQSKISEKLTVNSKTNEMPYLYNLTNYMLETLPKLPTDPNPKFVYAHFIVTHTPFYFIADGELIDQSYRAKILDYDTFKVGYSNQVDFMNSRLQTVISKILEKSTTPPIIVFQSDHGFDQRPDKPTFRPNQNLIAIFLPGIHKEPYTSISSVNIFRYILNESFGMDFPYLEDISYKVNGKDYSLIRVYDLEPGCK
jgi:hypothetical protein